MMQKPDPRYRQRFPAEIIGHAVWLYHVFSLSLRDVELILAERGVVVSYETVRRWCKKFAASFADRLRSRRPQPGDKWQTDKVFIRIQGVPHYLRRAVAIRAALHSTFSFRRHAMPTPQSASSGDV